MKKQHGFTLLELMIALLLSAFTLSLVIGIFTSNMQSTRLQMAFSNVQESGRMSMEFINRDLRLTDHWGCLNDPGKLTSRLDKTDSDWHTELDFLASNSKMLDSIDNATGAEKIGPSLATKSPIAGSDVLTIRGSQPTGVMLNQSLTSLSEDLILTGPASKIAKVNQAGQVLLISNCNQGELFSVSKNITTNRLAHRVTSTASTGVNNSNAEFSYLYEAGSSVLLMSSKHYFVAASEALPGVNALWRSDSARNQGKPVEIVPNVDDMQLTFGIDIDGDGKIDRYADKNTIQSNNWDMDNVHSVRVELVIASSVQVQATALTSVTTAQKNYPDDKRLRKIYSAVSRIRNRESRT
ncbi:MAG: PilW family protein [Pseudomonadales bacterium]|nr:PilW family protein [Pseudomonadales bacterium]